MLGEKAELLKAHMEHGITQRSSRIGLLERKGRLPNNGEIGDNCLRSAWPAPDVCLGDLISGVRGVALEAALYVQRSQGIDTTT